jgi:hypothetical protein
VRITIEIDNDVLAAAEKLARQQSVPVSKVISNLARDALSGQFRDPVATVPTMHGFRPFPGRGKLTSNEDVDKLRNFEGV